MRKIVSIMNATPHVNAYCLTCGKPIGSSIDTYEARKALFRHMRQKGHEEGSIEVGRVSQYRLISSNK